MDQSAATAIARATAFANGLRKNTLTAGRRWSAWPGGANDLARVLAIIDGIQQKLKAGAGASDAEAVAAACINDLRAVLEWTTYQSAAIATARALRVARRTRTFAEQFGLLDGLATSLTALEEAEESLIATVRTRNAYMDAVAERHPHLGFPRPLAPVDAVVRKSEPPSGRLLLIQQLMKSKAKSRR